MSAATNYKVLTEDGQLSRELSSYGGKLVIVDFTSARCPPCQRMAPFFADMAIKYPRAIFLKLDITECPNSAASQGVSATPTFIFYRNSTKLYTLQGADPETLETKISMHVDSDEDEDTESCGVTGHIDLLPMVKKGNCECLNESDNHSLMSALTSSDSSYLESDTDEQLIINIEFNQPIKMHSLRIKGPTENGPKTIKIFINQPYSLDFDGAESGVPCQEFILTSKELEGGLVTLKYVKFQNVQSMTIFVKDNQNDSELTRINYLQLIGSPVATTNMSDFKRVSGKKGESH